MDKWGTRTTTHHDLKKIVEMFEQYDKDSAKATEEDEEDELTPVTSEDRLFESFAKEAMRGLVEHGIADFVLLKNDKLRAWWQRVVKQEQIAQAKREAAAHKKMLKEQALAKLSDEEKEALGLTRKKK